MLRMQYSACSLGNAWKREKFKKRSKVIPGKNHHSNKEFMGISFRKSCWIKGAVSRYSVIFCAFFAPANNGDCSRKCRGHRTMTAWSAARTTSPPKLCRANIVFRGLALLPPLFSPHKMAAKNHRLSWHCRFKDFPASMQFVAKVQMMSNV